jgi:glucose/arabinose dehydrogenase
MSTVALIEITNLILTKNRNNMQNKNATQMRSCHWRLLVTNFLLVFLLISVGAFAQSLPSGFQRQQAASGLSSPTALEVAPDGRIFICQQGGTLRIFKNGALLATPFLTKSVHSSGERGLIGIALDPNFSSNGYVYIYFTLPDGSRNRISRVTANGDVMQANSEVTVLNLDPLSSATNHNGGGMVFGADGKLYVGVGDNANSNNAQSLDTYHGKLLRINADGSIPAGNPYTTGSEQRRRVWSHGLRNPFTLDVQPGTGKIFVNDVGQSSWEEVNDATASGKNFGWPMREGYSTDFDSPIYAYGRGSSDGVGCSIAGGTFFNPTTTNWPAQYVGKYFFLDYCSSWINYLTINSIPAPRSAFGTNLGGSVVGLEVGTDGNLYYLSRGAGALYRIVYTLDNTPNITSHPQSVSVSPGQIASFTVTATGSTPLSYQWQKNNANIAGATSTTYTIANVNATHAGQYRVIVTNSAGSVTSNAATLTVSNPPTAQIITPAEGTTYTAGSTISYSGNGTDTEDGTLPASAFTWWVDFHHDTHTHPHVAATTGSKTGTFTIPNQGETSANVWYRLYLRVTDSQGATHTVFRDVTPLTSTITLLTQPEGLRVTLDGQPQTTPATITSVEGLLRTIGAVTQTVGGVTYEFDKWLHGGAASQTITTPAENVTYTAVYKVGTTPVNLALNKVVATSSVEPNSTLVGANAVDGNLSTRWGSAYTDNQWLYVDLADTYSINRVKITWETAYGRNYEIQTSSNATTWTTIKPITGNTTLVNDHTGLTGTGRYLRILGTARGTQWGYSIFELEVYGTGGCAVPSQPGAISGNTSVTPGTSQTYSIAAVSGATSYTWTLPSGWTGASTSTSISAIAGTIGGTISVRANNSCGSSASSTLAVTIGCDAQLPQPGPISGNTSVLAGSTQMYSISSVGGATSYTWILPAGWSGSSTSTSITTTVGTTGGTISVRATNSCGSSNPSSLVVTISTPSGNLALNKSVTTSSVEPNTSFVGSNAVDGSASTRWSSAFVDPSWIAVDLGDTYTINRVKITWETAYGRNYQIQLSSNGTTWTTLKPVTNNTALVNDHTALSGTGRYIRIYGTTRATQWGYSIFELEVYGAASTARSASSLIAEESGDDQYVFPNPVMTDLSIKAWPEFKGGQIKITNAEGREFMSEKADADVINVSKLPAGYYILRLVKDQRYLTRKFEKK